MILDPINAITSVEFYRKVAAQTVGRSLLYLVYLSVLFSIAGTLALKMKIGPVVDETFVWLERSMPTITFEGGKLSTKDQLPVTIRHPRIPEVAVKIDTVSTGTVTAQTLEAAKVVAYVTRDAMFLMERPGEMRSFDFSTAAAGKPVVIDGAFYRNAGMLLSRALPPISLALTFVIFLAWKTFSTFFYSLIALMVNAVAEGDLSYKSLFNLTLYAQTLTIAIQAIFLFMPVGLPAAPLVAMALTTTYLWLAVKRLVEPPAA